MKRVVGAAHEDLAHQIEDGVGETLVGPVGDDALVDAIPWQAGLHVGGAQDAAGASVAIRGGRGKVIEQLAFVPDMVAGGHHVGAEIEQLLGDLGRHAKAAGGVLDIHDGEVDVMGFAHVADVFAHDFATCAAEDVADEEDVH